MAAWRDTAICQIVFLVFLTILVDIWFDLSYYNGMKTNMKNGLVQKSLSFNVQTTGRQQIL